MACSGRTSHSLVIIMKEFGLIGRKIGHSYSAKYFNSKFQKEGIDAKYDLYPLAEIDEFRKLIASHPLLCGLNVTIPYKTEVIRYLTDLSEEAAEIGAVNVIKISRNGDSLRLTGYNSDAYGFLESLKDLLLSHGLPLPSSQGERADKKALVLGTGGASRAVVWSLKQLGFDPQLVGRRHRDNCLSYDELSPVLVSEAAVIVNTTPLGMDPDIDSAASIPYDSLHEGQVCYDIVYNPENTLFMQKCKSHGCVVSNGLEMLRLQAEGAWRIWSGTN